MYILQRKQNDGTIYYYTYEGWKMCGSSDTGIDIKDVVRFTHGEMYNNRDLLGPREQFQWYGSYGK